MRQKWFTLVVCGIVAVSLLVYLFSFQVRINEVVVHRRLGRFKRTINQDGKDPGWKLKLPYPIDEIYRFDRRLFVLESRLTEQQTVEKFNINVKVFMVWHIIDPNKFLRSVRGNVKTANEQLKDLLTTEKYLFSQVGLNNLVNTDKEKLAHGGIENEICRKVNEKAKELYGIEVVRAGLTRLNLPQSTTSLVFRRMRAERKRMADAIRTEGEREATTIKARADQKRRETLAKANAQAQIIRGEGEAEEAKYYDVFAQEPELANFLRTLDAIRKLAESAKERKGQLTFILDTSTPPFSILKQGPAAGMPASEGKADKRKKSGESQ